MFSLLYYPGILPHPNSNVKGYFREKQDVFSEKTGIPSGKVPQNGVRISRMKGITYRPARKIPSVYEQSMGAHRSSVPFNGEIPTPACGLPRNDALIGEHLGMTRNRGKIFWEEAGEKNFPHAA